MREAVICSKQGARERRRRRSSQLRPVRPVLFVLWLILLSATSPLRAAESPDDNPDETLNANPDEGAESAESSAAGANRTANPSAPPLSQSTLRSDTALATEGYFVLSWDSDSPTESLLLQRAATPEFTTPLDRPVAASGSLTITGLEDGLYYFRLIDETGATSELLRVEVAHHSLARSLGFFALGLVLFSILMFSIFAGHRRTRRDSHAP